MTRHHTAIAFLLASAGLLAAILALMPATQTVRGDMQAANADYLLLTARAVDNGDDSVIVLDKLTGKLLTYQLRTDATGGVRLLLTNPLDLTKVCKPKP